MDRMPNLLLTVMTVVLGIATALMAVTVPSLWSMAGDLGTIKGRLEGVDREISRRFEQVDKRLEGIEGALGVLTKRVDAIDSRLAERETDPATLVARSGLRPESEFGGLRVGDKLFVLPKTDKAQSELAGAGIPREAITPSTFGYLLGRFDAAGRLTLIGGASSEPAPGRP